MFLNSTKYHSSRFTEDEKEIFFSFLVEEKEEFTRDEFMIPPSNVQNFNTGLDISFSSLLC